MKFIVI